jgi:AbiTii
MGSRSQAILSLARELVDDIELTRLVPESILLKALRLARLVEDPETLEWLQFELNGYPNSSAAKPWMRRFGRFTDEAKAVGYWIPLAGVAGTMATMQAQIQTLTVPNVHFAPSSANPHEYVAGWLGATADKIAQPANAVLGRLQALTTGVSTLSSIRSRVLAAVHEFAVRQYHALAFENLSESIFESHRVIIDRVLAEAAPTVLDKLPAVMDRLAAGDAEAVSQAMNSVRRMIKALADRVYPPTSEPVLVDGQKYEVGADKVLNRLKLFLSTNCSSESRRNRLNRSIRDINERAAAGAHADVTYSEARALMLAAYLTLGEIVQCADITTKRMPLSNKPPQPTSGVEPVVLAPNDDNAARG